MVLTLYGVNASPPVRAVLMTIKALNIPDVKFVEVNVFKKEHQTESYMKLNPQHTIPTLTDDDFVIWDSHAIATYLVTKYGSDDKLYPKDPQKRAVVDQRLHFDSGILFASIINITKPLFTSGVTPGPEKFENMKDAYKHLEKFLDSTTWLAGDSVTLADICCIVSVGAMDAFVPIKKTEYPNIIAWMERCSELDFYKTENLPGYTAAKELLKSKLGDFLDQMNKNE